MIRKDVSYFDPLSGTLKICPRIGNIDKELTIQLGSRHRSQLMIRKIITAEETNKKLRE